MERPAAYAVILRHAWCAPLVCQPEMTQLPPLPCANATVGRPIDVRKDSSPSDEYVQEVHAQYIEELVRIWDKYKDLYAKTRTRELRVVD